MTISANDLLRYEYNSLNQLVKTFRTYSKSETLLNEKEYDQNPSPLAGFEVNPTFFFVNSTKPVLFFDFTFANSPSNLIKQKNYNDSGALTSTITYLFEYNSEKLPTKMIVGETNGKSYSNYTYDCK